MTNQLALFSDTSTPAPTPPATTPGGPATWLTAHLIRTGHLTETGLSRRARLHPCTHCHHLILSGLDADQCALEAHTDPTPLNPLGEALTHITNHRTYTLRREGPRYVLDPRTAWDIQANPAGTTPRTDTLRQHHCGTPPPPTACTAPTGFPEHRPPLPAGSQPPF